jgi:gas vesicle protein
MGRHNKRKMSIEDRDMSRSESSDLGTTAKETVDTVLDRINDNKLLIGSIIGACGAAVFLLTTETGKKLTRQVQQGASDLYGFVSDQVGTGVNRVRDVMKNMASGSQSGIKKTSTEIRRVS